MEKSERITDTISICLALMVLGVIKTKRLLTEWRLQKEKEKF